MVGKPQDNYSAAHRLDGPHASGWRDRDERAIAELKANGIIPAMREGDFRKDGDRCAVLIGAAIL